MASQPRGLPRHRVLVSAHDLAQLLRINLSAEIDRADKIDEHDCELAALGRSWRRCCRLVPRQEAGRFENFPPVANGVDTDLLEIFNCQTRQDLKVDAIVPEGLLVGLQTEGAQPFSDVQIRLRGAGAPFPL